MDHGFRSKLHGHLERLAILLRHVLALQRCRASVLRDASLLALLDVLRQPQYLVDWRCVAESETAVFDPPPGQTCTQYAGAFAQSSGGYLLQPDATQNCMMCPYSEANSYLATINISPEDKWRDFGIFLVFTATNYMLVSSVLIFPTKLPSRPLTCFPGLLLHLHRPCQGLELWLRRALPRSWLSRQHDQGSFQGHVQEEGAAARVAFTIFRPSFFYVYNQWDAQDTKRERKDPIR
jgi:hypothetical protein